MKKKKFCRTALLCLAAALCLTGTAAIRARADFGDMNDYDSGGNDDWGNDDWGNDSWDNDSWDSGYSYDDGDSGGSSPVYSLIIVVGVTLMFYYISSSGRSRGRSGTVKSHPASRGAAMPADQTAEVEGRIRQTDPEFSAPDFLAFVRNVFMELQDAWMKRDIEPIRPLMHDNLYAQTRQQVEQKKARGIINYMERISVREAWISDMQIVREGGKLYLTVILHASMTDYQVEEKTGRVIAGDRQRLWDLYYRMRFVRALDAKTLKKDGDSYLCPQCGAPLESGAAEICQYCGSVIRGDGSEWVLCEYTVIK